MVGRPSLLGIPTSQSPSRSVAAMATISAPQRQSLLRWAIGAVLLGIVALVAGFLTLDDSGGLLLVVGTTSFAGGISFAFGWFYSGANRQG
jgi:hypothetical protein